MSNKPLIPHPLAPIIQAFADGYKIQSKCGPMGNWVPCRNPSFFVGTGVEYRVEPETIEIANYFVRWERGILNYYPDVKVMRIEELRREYPGALFVEVPGSRYTEEAPVL